MSFNLDNESVIYIHLNLKMSQLVSLSPSFAKNENALIIYLLMLTERLVRKQNCSFNRI